MKKQNNIIGAVVGIALVVAVVLTAGSLLKGRGPQGVNNQPVADPAELINFLFFGNITSLSNNGIILTLQDSEKSQSVVINNNTKVVRQVTGDDGVIKLVDAKFSDLKVGDRVVVRFLREGSTYVAEQIQLHVE